MSLFSYEDGPGTVVISVWRAIVILSAAGIAGL